jgi:hypothetical protein
MSGLIRTLKLGCVGDDVDGWARAAHRYLEDGLLDDYEMQRPIVRRTFGIGKRTLAKKCARKAGLPQYGIVGETLEEAMRAAGAFDATADARIDRYNAAQVDEGLELARKLLDYCRRFDGGYKLGGGHGRPLATVTPDQDLDCSSSTSRALYEFGLYLGPNAQVSGDFRRWGDGGRGRYVTVHANVDHVWVEFTLPEGWWRFDTSPHGDGDRGPRVRGSRRFDRSFAHRHPRGM